MLAVQSFAHRACMAMLLLLSGCLLYSCGSPLRVYTSPTLKDVHQRPQTIAILPLDLTINTSVASGSVEETPLTTGEAAMFQQMLYSILLEQGSKRPVTIRNIDSRQLPAGPPIINTALAKQLGVETFLVTKLHRIQTLYPTTASTVTTYEKSTATTTSTPASVHSRDEVLLDMELYNAQGQLLWKYNAQTTPWLSTPARAIEFLMEEGLRKFPFRR